MKYNKKIATTKTTNLAGGEAYSESDKLEIVSVLLTNFMNDTFYRTENDTEKRILELVSKIKDKKFVAKAAIYARTEFGMRTVSHLVAAEIVKTVKGEEWTKEFINKVIYRPDDMLEILSYYLEKYKKPIPNSLKKGFRLALDKFDDYQISKYKGEGKEVKMVDIVNLVHPSHSKIFKKLVDGKLKNVDTWETRLTQAGQNAEDKETLKKDAWASLIKEKKLGYFALLRNLRNILTQAPELTDKVCKLLTDKEMINKSLVLPFRYLTAINEVNKISGVDARKVIVALNKAIDIATSNVPKFKGTTLVALDCSGSMAVLKDKAALFAAIMCKSNNADLVIFEETARYVNYNTNDSTLTLANSIPYPGGSTNFQSIFRTINKAYDRIIIISDMQSWVEHELPKSVYSDYKKKFKAKPNLYCWDMQGYGTLQFPEKSVYCLAGWSEKVFDLMGKLEKGTDSLIKEIDKIEF